MPIKPENRNRYPAQWPEIRLQILERAHWRCEHPECGAHQYAIGRWQLKDDGSPRWEPIKGNTPATTQQDRTMHRAGVGQDSAGNPWTYAAARAFLKEYAWEDPQPIIIVLTVAHLNHRPEDCRPENLKAWCQRHHLAYDLEHHQQNAQTTRRSRKAIGELF